ncbi:MAG: hypothetical protein PVJ49_09905 [Acidobacteriota bacterium]|jgi:uncharacterized repeat protein (TIGR01451 family)
MLLRFSWPILPVALILAPFYVAEAQETGNVCVRDFQPGAVCTANDVRIQELTLVTLIEGCGDGTIGEAEGLFEVLISAEGSPNRFDIGIFLATDGGSARDGDACYHDYLEPPLNATPMFGDANSDGIPDLAAPPWQEIDADQCGDIQTNTQVIKPMPVTRFSCTDSDNDGFVDANVCPTWDNNAVTNCASLSDAFPGTNSKCGCATVSLGIPVFSPAPAISVSKSPPDQTVSVGEDANFILTVDNTGNVQLENVIVDDPQCTTLTGPAGDDGDDILQTTETWTYTCSATGVTTSFTNVVSVTATPSSGGSDVTDTDSADVDVTTVPSPAIAVAKTPPNQIISSGDDANFVISVDNTGDVALENVIVDDPQCTSLTGPTGDDGDAILQTTETWSYACTVTGVTVSFTNAVTVKATPTTGGADVTDSASADVNVLRAVPMLPLWMTAALAAMLIAAGLLRMRYQAGVSPD